MRTPRRFVEAPPTTPAPFGLLSVATVLEDSDDKVAFGTIYQPDACGPSSTDVGPCSPDYMGTLTIEVDDASTATVTMVNDPTRPSTAVLIDWGDGDDPEQVTLPAAGVTHTYSADDTYTVTVSDDRRHQTGTWTGTADVVVTDGVESGPYSVLSTSGRSGYDEDGRPTTESHPFSVYRLTTCRLVGEQPGQAEARAERELHLGESRAVEAYVAELLAIEAGDGDALLVATAQHPVLALAYLEDYARANYGGVPVIHMPVFVATLLESLHCVERNGTQLVTKNGSLVAAGYPDWNGTLPLPWDGTGALEFPDADTELVMYVTGQVTIRRGPVQSMEATTGASRVHNERSARAERPYDVSWDCATAAVLVKRDPFTVTP